MKNESILLIGRNTRNAQEVLKAHAERLNRRGVVDDIVIATYECEPIRELREEFERISTGTVYAVPMVVAHSHDTITGVPAALSYISGDVHYCEPIGQSPAVTEVIKEKAASMVPASDDVSLILVGFGSSSKPYYQQTANYHAARLREQSGYGEVLTCYLLQNPTVECVRYNTTKNQSVAVPICLTGTEASESRIPDKLELARGGIEYADPFGKHPRITDAVHAEVEKQRALAVNDAALAASFEARLTRTQRPVATDGEGNQQ